MDNGIRELEECWGGLNRGWVGDCEDEMDSYVVVGG